MSFNQLTNVERAHAAWGGEMPTWVRLLATACDRDGQQGAAQLLGWNSATVSRLLNRKYGASYDEAETRVRATFGAEVVDCPVVGEIALKTCVSHRRRKGMPIAVHHRWFAANCPNCPFNTDTDEED